MNSTPGCACGWNRRGHVERRLQGLLTAARPEDLATAAERLTAERLDTLERRLEGRQGTAADRAGLRIARLRGLLLWRMRTDYDRRLTRAHEDLAALNGDIERLQRQYGSFVRSRQAATQSYQGYDATMRRQTAADPDSGGAGRDPDGAPGAHVGSHGRE